MKSKKNPIDFAPYLSHLRGWQVSSCFTKKNLLKPPHRNASEKSGTPQPRSHSPGPFTWRPTWTTHRSKPPKSQRTGDHLYQKHMSSVQLAKVVTLAVFLFIRLFVEKRPENHPYIPLVFFGGSFVYSLKRPDRIIPFLPVGNPWKWLQQLLGHAVPAVKIKGLQCAVILVGRISPS